MSLGLAAHRGDANVLFLRAMFGRANTAGNSLAVTYTQAAPQAGGVQRARGLGQGRALPISLLPYPSRNAASPTAVPSRCRWPSRISFGEAP